MKDILKSFVRGFVCGYAGSWIGYNKLDRKHLAMI